MPLRRFGGIGSCLAPILLAGFRLVAHGQSTFSLNSATPSVTISPGQTAQVDFQLTSLGGFSGTVSLRYMVPASLGTLRAAPSSVSVHPYGPSIGRLEIATLPSAVPRAYSVIIQGTDSGTIKTLAINVDLTLSAPILAPRFSMTVDPARRSVARGQSVAFRVTLSSEDGQGHAVTLSLAGPSGFGGAAFSPNPLTLGPDRPASTVLTLAVDQSAPLGAVTWIVRASSGGIAVHEVPVALTITPAPDFVLSTESAGRTVSRGQTANYSLSVQARLGFTGTITFSLSGLAGQAAFSPNPVPVGVTGLANTTLNITTSAETPMGTFPFTVRASASNGTERDQALWLAVTAIRPPAISVGGVVSGAGFRRGLSRGSIASLFGDALAGGTYAATAVPLPRMLGTTRVQVNGIDAPLFYADPRQINFQIPFEAPLQGVVAVAVARDGMTSPPVAVPLEEYAPSIFVHARTPGVLDPVVTHPDGSLVTPENPARGGEVVIIYGTGIGNLTAPLVSGDRAPSPAAHAAQLPIITLGDVKLTVEFAGLSPGYVGLAQFNVRIPRAIPGGAADLPLQIRIGPAASQVVTLPVRQR